MNILVIGAGGREHALIWKLRQSPSTKRLYCAPGNAGIAEHAEVIPINAMDLKGLADFAQKTSIDLTVVGPEQPLVEGIVDLFEQRGLLIFGPSKAAAQLEGSKVFAKDFMVRYGIPTARFKSFAIDQHEVARHALIDMTFPIVVKADGLAAGKGVLICDRQEQASHAIDTLFKEQRFGAAGHRIVIEEYLEGEEVSLFALSDGSDFVTLAAAQDHKRVFDGDQGMNTGGMGAYAPAPIMTTSLRQQVIDRIVLPTLRGMQNEGYPFRGCLYCGLMVTRDETFVLEYNCRFGDPETQVVVPLFQGDFAALLRSIAEKKLDQSSMKPTTASAVCVVMASKGYPDDYERGKRIDGLVSAQSLRNVMVFHAGTAKNREDIVTTGGRVLGVTAVGDDGDLQKTIALAYHAVDRISFDGAHFRTDIGKKALPVTK